MSKPGDYPEDYADGENQYENVCPQCKASFYGHKRRVICKRCIMSDKPEVVGYLIGGMLSAGSRGHADHEPLIRLTDHEAAMVETLKRARTAERESMKYMKQYSELEKVAKVVSEDSDRVCAQLNLAMQAHAKLLGLLREARTAMATGLTDINPHDEHVIARIEDALARQRGGADGQA